MSESGGGGYTIPISVSVADSFTVPQNQQSHTVINFGSYDNAHGGYVDWRDNSRVSMETNPATTATASTALGGDSNAAAQVGTGGGSSGKGNVLLIVAAIVVGAMIMKGRI